MNRLKKKIALVTGAAQGIGKAIADAMEKEGAKVIRSDIKPTPSGIYLDVQKEADWEKAMSYIASEFGALHILVNNAGITGFQEGFGPQDPENSSLESWRAVHAVNLDGVFLGCKHALPLMKASQGGSIINISSRSGIVGIPGAAAYASSKAAVRNHTKTVALYCCEKGYPIRCNSIHPAAILTPMWEPMLGIGAQREATMAMIAKDIPMRKMGTPEDVASAALFLASDESSYITGIELTVDGGILAGAAASPKKD
jgi:3(or 17)beta-hydroxysteroid dehydrogenase